jgi:hypothetical protein
MLRVAEVTEFLHDTEAVEVEVLTISAVPGIGEALIAGTW